MVVAIERLLAEASELNGSIGFLITSDEEADAVDGTVKVIDILQRNGTHIDYCIVGEPSSNRRVGDMVRVGRRGSLNGRARIRGIQGHVAYPEKVRNPIHLAAPAMAELATRRWDDGNDYFPATTLSDFECARRHRCNERRSRQRSSCCSTSASTPSRRRSDCKQRSRRCSPATGSTRTSPGHCRDLRSSPSAGGLVDAVSGSIRQVTGADPELSTGGGTSDGRFIAPTGAEVIEVGVVNETIHSVDECVAVADVATLVDIYAGILRRLLRN